MPRTGAEAAVKPPTRVQFVPNAEDALGSGEHFSLGANVPGTTPLPSPGRALASRGQARVRG